jgi:hypothetical protein
MTKQRNKYGEAGEVEVAVSSSAADESVSTPNSPGLNICPIPPSVLSLLPPATARRKKKMERNRSSQDANTPNVSIHTNLSQWVSVAV